MAPVSSISKTTLLFSLMIIPFFLQAQENRYMVFFNDKEGGNPYTISAPESFLGEKALARRTKQQIAVTAQDLPVTPAYVQGVISAGATYFYATRWMNGILVQCDAALVDDLEALPYVKEVELVAPDAKPASGARTGGTGTRIASAVTNTQLAMLGLDKLHAAGYHAEGITIAVMDAGFIGVNTANPFKPIIDEGRLNQAVSYDFVHRESNIFQQDSHGTEVFSVIAAYEADTYVGGAYKANYQLYITEHIATEYRIEEYNWLFAAERADSAGVDVINGSLGYNTFDDATMNYNKTTDLDGNTAVITRAAQWAADRGIIVVASAGNEGSNSWGVITPPADARDVLAAASVNNIGVRSASSSTGPTSDGRTKPDLAAMGVNAAVVEPSGSTGTATGTSFAAPLITSLAACVWQYFPEKTNKQIIELLRTSASQSAHPDNLLGYGIPNYSAIINKVEWDEQQHLIEVYPNPVRSTLNIRPKDPTQVVSTRIQITTLQGQPLTNEQIDFNWLNSTYSADCSALASGLYILHLWVDRQPLVFRFVKL